MRWLSIDLGRMTGIAVWDGERLRDHYTVDLGEDQDQRVRQLWRQLDDETMPYEEADRIGMIVVEAPRGHGRGWLAMGQLNEYLGIIRLYCGQRGIDFIELSQTEIKKAATGSGGAKKTEVQAAISAMYQINNPGKDEADAIAVGHCYLSISEEAA